MRRIKYTNQFKRDYKRERAGRHRSALGDALEKIVELLISDSPLPPSYNDHPLGGEWKDRRDCHIRPDLVLIYRKPDLETLELVRLGSHSELF
jgi:mRNA interferase YafQ